MEKKAAERLGEIILAGSIISTSGTGRSIGTSVLGAQLGGAIGAAAAGAIGAAAAGAVGMAGSQPGCVPSLGDYRGLLYVGVGVTRVGFFKVSRGLVGPSLKELVLTVPRDAIATFDLRGGALTCPLSVGLRDGTVLDLEVPRAHKGRVERIAALFPQAA